MAAHLLRHVARKFCSICRGPNIINKFPYLFKSRSWHFLRWNNTGLSRNVPRFALYSGILSYLGLAKEEEEKPEDPVVLTIKRSILLMQQEDYDTAEQMLHLALKMAQERADTTAETYIYDIMANVAYQKRDFAKAEKLFVEVMRRLISGGTPQNDNAIIEISLKMATMYAALPQDHKAIDGFRFCIDTQQEKLESMRLDDTLQLTELEEDTLVLWAMSVDSYARFLLSRGRYKEAQEHFEKAFVVSERVNGPSGEQTLVLMNDIGSVATLRKDFDKAIEVLQQAIARGQSSPDLPSFYCNLGATYLRKGDNEKAHFACSDALRLSRKLEHKEAEADAKGCLEEVRKMKTQ